VKEGKFREDLFYRLSVVPLRLPPLRERKDDIPLLLVHYLGRFAKENGLPPVRLSPEAEATLVRYAWPGNIRELRNACENLAVLRAGKEVAAADLDARFTQAAVPLTSAGPVPASQLLDRTHNEKQLLKQALAAAGGNRTKAAELMGISRRTLHRKLLQWPELDPGPETSP
jgi:DNA-binding NtrC family response regulator